MIDWNSHAVIDSVSQHIYQPLLTLLGILNLFIGSFAIFIVATKSPRSTRTYNALLLNILCWSFAADFFQAVLCQFDAHWPVPCFRAHGIVTLFNFGETVLDILATLIVIIYCNMIIAAALPVSFRCAQLLYRSTMKRVPRWGGILYCMCWHLAVGGAGLYLYTACIVPADIYRDNTIEYHQFQYQAVSTKMIDWNSHAVIDSVSQHIYLPLLTLLGILNLFIGSFAIFIVATKSPRSTRTYNALLLNILFWSFAADFFQAILCQFDAHWPVPCFRAHGIVTLFNFGETVLDILATLIVIIYCNMIIAAALPMSDDVCSSAIFHNNHFSCFGAGGSHILDSYSIGINRAISPLRLAFAMTGSHTVNSFSQQIYLPLLTTLGIVNLFIGSFTIFIVATKSPQHTRTYNALLLNILCWSFAADFLQAAIGQFEAHWPAPCFRAHGIAELFNVGETFLGILITVMVVIYCNMIIAAGLPVSFRSAQLLYPSKANSVPRWAGILYCTVWHVMSTTTAMI
ncbi:hypothetical protein QR680_015730 [Steinernema hermaphroditum]|uniref:Uncharacterized protein n=1 Tax=Steinernema hermaphroditum TaxID=289476 RepID=A0AA39H8S0_9BILA|nr:hypothetical protein QR680_015730 [Steinernema hermaphroditum]